MTGSPSTRCVPWLRAELTAAERCEVALDSVEDERLKRPIASCRAPTCALARVLGQELARAGGRLPDDAGLRGALARLVQRAASGVSDKVGLAALQRGELRHRRRYRQALKKLKSGPHRLLRARLLPEQRRTLDVVSRAAHGT